MGARNQKGKSIRGGVLVGKNRHTSYEKHSPWESYGRFLLLSPEKKHTYITLNKIEKILYARDRNAPSENFTTARSMLVRYW